MLWGEVADEPILQSQMDADGRGFPLRLERGESDATLAHRMGERLGVRASGVMSNSKSSLAKCAVCGKYVTTNLN